MVDWNLVEQNISEFGRVYMLEEDEDPSDYEKKANFLDRRLAEALIRVKVRNNSDLVKLWECLDVDWSSPAGYEEGDSQLNLIPMNETCWITVQDNVAYVETKEDTLNRCKDFIEQIFC